MEEIINAVSVESLSKAFPIPFRKRRLLAVRDLSLKVESGQVYGLLGPNGSGKSTTLKAILGLLRPDSGKTSIFGMDSGDVRSREQVGYLPENPYFYKYLTGKETLRFFGRICGLPKKENENRINELLELVGLQNASDRRLGGYSKGMLQRIGLAQALIQRPRLLVLDEPTAGVDPAGSNDIKNLILQLKEEGITVLLCSHLLAQVQEICDRVGIIARGKLVKEGPLDELISIDNQTEILIKNSNPALLKQIEDLVDASDSQLISVRRPRTTLERLFLTETTGAGIDSAEQGMENNQRGENSRS